MMRRAPGRWGALLLCICCLSTAAWSALGPRYGGELTVAVARLPAETTPGVPLTDGDRLIGRLAHETLVGLEPDGFPTPALVAAWTSAAGGREWTLELRANAKFHDGEVLTAEHAVSALRRFFRSASPAAAAAAQNLEGGGAFRRGETDQLPGVLAAGSRGLVLRLLRQTALPFAALAAPAAAVTGRRGAGCGPFAPTLRLPGGAGVVLAAFGEHIRGRPFLDQVRVVATRGSDAATSGLAAGRLDVAPGPGLASAPASILLLVLDRARAPFHRAEDRRLVSEAIARDELVKHLMPEAEATPSLLPAPLLPGLAETLPVGIGRSLTGSVTMAVAENVPPLVSQRVLAHLSALGLDVSVDPVEPASIATATTEARLLVWTPEVPEAGLALRELAALGRSDGRVTEELDAADLELNPDRRRVMLLRVEAALRAEACLVPVASTPVSFAVREGVHGVSVDAGGRLVLEDAWVEP